ncbi:MAG: 6-phosphofructokinase [Myxococcota bacterium]
MHIGVLTSGGDAPGMNAAIRALVKAATGAGHAIVGFGRGYEGLIAGDGVPLALSAVDGLSRVGGTVLGSARCKEFETPEGRARAVAQIERHGLGGLVVIGGNGSLTGAHVLSQVTPCRVVGIPASIDNDLGHTGLAIGVDTAVNTIVEACDRIADTATAHRRVFVIEVMGRKCGFLAMRGGIAADADAILVPERGWDRDRILAVCTALLERSFAPGRNKQRVLIVKAEGVPYDTRELVADLGRWLAPHGVDARETVLGHLVRGGSPSALDRLVAQRLAFGALHAIEDGATDVMLAWEPVGEPGAPTRDRSVRRVPLAEMLSETTRLLDGSSPVTRSRLALLDLADGLLAL